MGDLTVLLDTHVLLWMLAEPEKLSAECRIAVEKPDTRLLVSTVSLFEVSTKVRIGKLSSAGPLLSETEWTLSRLNVELLPLSAAAAVLAGQLDVPHRDPFDRLLAAQAVTSNVALASNDAAFRLFEGVRVLW